MGLYDLQSAYCCFLLMNSVRSRRTRDAYAARPLDEADHDELVGVVRCQADFRYHLVPLAHVLGIRFLVALHVERLLRRTSPERTPAKLAIEVGIEFSLDGCPQFGVVGLEHHVFHVPTDPANRRQEQAPNADIRPRVLTAQSTGSPDANATAR